MKAINVSLVGLILIIFHCSVVTGQSVEQYCKIDEGLFFGDPFTIRYGVLVDPSEEEPIIDPYENLFPNTSEQSTNDNNCNEDGIVGALNCASSDMASAIENAAIVDAGEHAPGSGEKSEQEFCPPIGPQYLEVMITVQPVFSPGAPSIIALQPLGRASISGPEEVDESQLQHAAELFAAQMAKLNSWRQETDLESMDSILDGNHPTLKLPLLAGVEQLGKTPTLRLPMSCGSLFQHKVELTELVNKRQKLVDSIQKKERQIAEQREKSGVTGWFVDSDWVNRAEDFIEREQGKLSDLDKLIAEKNDQIIRRDTRLKKDNREISIGEIHKDPKRLAEEEERRKEEFIAAARDRRQYEIRLEIGEREYARHIAGFDAMVEAARAEGNDELADRIAEDLYRLERARDQWVDHATSMSEVRAREVNQLRKRNAAEGIGPTENAWAFMLNEGLDYHETLEAGVLQKAHEDAARQAAYDAITLGGSATESYNLSDFAKDFLETNAEMLKDPRILVGLPPKLFVERYSAYAAGVGKATLDVATDALYLAYKASALIGEAYWSDVSDIYGVELGTSDQTLGEMVALGEQVADLDGRKLVRQIASAADRKLSHLATSGEKGILEALYGTGYTTASLLMAEEAAMVAYLRARRHVGQGMDLIRKGCKAKPDTLVAKATVRNSPSAQNARSADHTIQPEMQDTVRYGDADTIKEVPRTEAGDQLPYEEVQRNMDANDAEPLLPGPEELPPGTLSRDLSDSEIVELFETGRDLTPEQVSQKADLLRARERARRVGDTETFQHLDERIANAEAAARGFDPEAPTQASQNARSADHTIQPEMQDTVRYGDADTIKEVPRTEAGDQLPYEEVQRNMDANDAEPLLPGPEELPPGTLSRDLSDSEIVELFETGRDLTPEQVSQKADLLRARERARRVGDTETFQHLDERIANAEAAARGFDPEAPTQASQNARSADHTIQPEMQDTVRYGDADTIKEVPRTEAGDQLPYEEVQRNMDANDAEPLLPGPEELPPGTLSRDLSDSEIVELFETGRDLTPEQVSQKADLLRARERARRVGDTETFQHLDERIANAEAAARGFDPEAPTQAYSQNEGPLTPDIPYDYVPPEKRATARMPPPKGSEPYLETKKLQRTGEVEPQFEFPDEIDRVAPTQRVARIDGNVDGGAGRSASTKNIEQNEGSLVTGVLDRDAPKQPDAYGESDPILNPDTGKTERIEPYIDNRITRIEPGPEGREHTPTHSRPEAADPDGTIYVPPPVKKRPFLAESDPSDPFSRPLTPGFSRRGPPNGRLDGELNVVPLHKTDKAGKVITTDEKFLRRGDQVLADGEDRAITVGKKLSEGGFTTTYLDELDPHAVVKHRYVPADGPKAESIEMVIHDSEVGREILKTMQDKDSYFRVVEPEGKPIIFEDPKEPGARHYVWREPNIASQVNGKTITNAQERIEARGYGLTEAEELTIQLTIRKLNHNGIVWTDAKLKNLDVVTDYTSPTGYRVLLFDFDGFRPVVGAANEKWKIARGLQKRADSLDTAKAGGAFAGSAPNAFNFNPFGRSVSTPISIGPNLMTEQYRTLNNLTPEDFVRQIDDFNASSPEKINFSLPDG